MKELMLAGVVVLLSGCAAKQPCLPNGGVVGILVDDGVKVPEGVQFPGEVSVPLESIAEAKALNLKGKAVISLQNLQTLVDACLVNAGEKKPAK